MELTLTQLIDRPAAEVWHLLAHRFEDVHEWLEFVVDSYRLPDAEPVAGAPTPGRVCELSAAEGGPQAWERITMFEDDARRMTIEVELRNAPAALPVATSVAVFEVVERGAKSEVRLTATPVLKAHGYLLYPLVKAGLRKNFAGILTALKATAQARPLAA